MPSTTDSVGLITSSEPSFKVAVNLSIDMLCEVILFFDVTDAFDRTTAPLRAVEPFFQT